MSQPITIAIVANREYNHIYGFNVSLSPTLQSIESQLIAYFKQYQPVNVITTGDIGFDQLTFILANRCKLRNIVASNNLILPFHHMDTKWLQSSKNRHRAHIQQADRVYYTSTTDTYSFEKMVAARIKAIDTCDIVIAIGDDVHDDTINQLPTRRIYNQAMLHAHAINKKVIYLDI